MYIQNFIQSPRIKRFWKPVISIPLRFISMILLRKTPSVSSAISADKSAPCHFLHPAVFLRFGQALDRLVTVSSMCCHTSTSALSTLSSSRGLTTCVGISHLEGGFTLRCLQRLSLPDLATLPCRWPTADTPVIRPSRSSRTKDSSSQISYAHAG